MPAGIRVVVFGGRTFRDSENLTLILDKLHAEYVFGLLIQGGARGADSLAKYWALRNNIPVAEFIANWNLQGRAAGPIRNQAMLDWGVPDLAIAFPGNKGTADMTERVLNIRPRITLITVLPAERLNHAG